MSDDSKKTRGEPENAKKFYGTNLPFNSQAPMEPTPKRKRLSQEEKDELRQMILDDNERIEHERTFGDLTARRSDSLKLSRLASLFKVTEHQIRYVVKDIY